MQFEIYFTDLTEHKQNEYVERFGYDANHDLAPLAIVDIEPEPEELTSFTFTNAETGDTIWKVEAENIDVAFDKLIQKIDIPVEFTERDECPDMPYFEMRTIKYKGGKTSMKILVR